jgi:hypothetical protein
MVHVYTPRWWEKKIGSFFRNFSPLLFLTLYFSATNEEEQAEEEEKENVKQKGKGKAKATPKKKVDPKKALKDKLADEIAIVSRFIEAENVNWD